MNLLRRPWCTLGIVVASCMLPITSDALAGAYEDGIAAIAAYDQGRFDAAYALWLPLAEQGDAGAQFNIGVLFEKGLGVAQDSAEAARWYLKAAEQGDVDAQYNVALMYERGAGLPRDLDEARSWYARVVANPRTDPGSLDTRRHAEKRLANLTVPEEIIAYNGGRFVLRPSVSRDCVVALQGIVSPDASAKFDDAMDKATEKQCKRPLILLLESPGGTISDGMALGRKVREERLRTVARYDCSSACSMIFLGGAERKLMGSRARIGFHQAKTFRQLSGNRGSSWSESCDDSKFDRASIQMKNYLDHTIPANADRIFQIVMDTPCTSIQYVYGQRALELGVATEVEAENVDVFGPKENR